MFEEVLLETEQFIEGMKAIITVGSTDKRMFWVAFCDSVVVRLVPPERALETLEGARAWILKYAGERNPYALAWIGSIVDRVVGKELLTAYVEYGQQVTAIQFEIIKRVIRRPGKEAQRLYDFVLLSEPVPDVFQGRLANVLQELR